jgi:hypothetical protein
VSPSSVVHFLCYSIIRCLFILNTISIAQFINPNGFQPAEPTTIFAFSPVVNRVSVVGDLAAWNTANPTLLAIEVVRMLSSFFAFQSQHWKYKLLV